MMALAFVWNRSPAVVTTRWRWARVANCLHGAGAPGARQAMAWRRA